MINIVHYVAIMNRGGQETFLMNLYRNADRCRFRFIFLCTIEETGDYDQEIISLGGRVEHLSINTTAGKLKPLINAEILRKWLHKHRNDIDIFEIHTQHAMDAYLSSQAAKRAGIKHVIVHSHNSNTTYYRKFHFLFRPLLIKTDITRFACSQLAGEWMYGKKSFEIIRNGIQTEEYIFNRKIRDQVRSSLNWENNCIIGHVGRFNEQKNHKFLIDAYAAIHSKYPETKLVLVGKGEMEKDIKEQIHRLQVDGSVDLLGVRDDVNDLYQGMDYFMFPSFFEGLSVVLVEAQASGLPCIISNHITPENIMTENIYPLDIENGTTIWVEKFSEIYGKDVDRRGASVSVIEKGYDMNTEAKRICGIYEEIAKYR